MNGWLIALFVLLAFALGLTLRDLATALTGGKYGGLVDFTGSDPRGELDLHWGDARRHDAGVLPRHGSRTSTSSSSPPAPGAADNSSAKVTSSPGPFSTPEGPVSKRQPNASSRPSRPKGS